MLNAKSIGIDDLAVCVPKRYIDTKELANFRNITPEKFTDGIGIKKIGICTEEESVVTMASSAIIDLIEENYLIPKDIGRIYIATETAIDESKPITSFVLGKLEKTYGKKSFSHIQAVEYKFACLGGSYALMDVCNWVSLNPNRVGIVVCTDEAKYDFLSSGEPTQGAGAVALLVRANPRLMSLNFTDVGVFTSDIDDFFRPSGKETPIVNGNLSTFSYLYAMREAFDSCWRMYKDKNKEQKSVHFTDAMDYFVLHTPYPNLVKHGAAMLIRHELRHTDRWKDEIENLRGIYNGGKTIEDIFSDGETFDSDYRLRKEIMKTEEFKQFYANKIEPGMWAPSEVGNTYTASIFLSLMSLLEAMRGENRLIEGQKIAFGGYGSGAGALGYQGEIQSEFANVVDNIRLKEDLQSRKQMTIVEYEISRMYAWGKKKYGEYNEKYGEVAKTVAKMGVEKAVDLLQKLDRKL